MATAAADARFQQEGPDFLRDVERIPAPRWLGARIPGNFDPEGNTLLHSLDFTVTAINDDGSTTPIFLSLVTCESLEPNERSDSSLIFEHAPVAEIEQFHFSWSSRRIRLTKEEFQQAGQYTTNLIGHSMARLENRVYRKLKPEQIQIDEHFQYLVLPYGSELVEGELEEGEEEEDDGEVGMGRRRLLLAEEVERSGSISLSALSSRILPALAQAVHGLGRYWKSSAFSTSVPLLRGVEPSEMIAPLATRDAMLAGNYETSEWFGDGAVESVAVDHAATSYDLRDWVPERFGFIKERITINHRLWKAGLRLRLHQYFSAEPFNKENLAKLLPYEPEDLPGSSFAVGKYSVRNKVWADIIEAIIGFYALKIGGFDLPAIKQLLQSLSVEFASYSSIHDDQGMKICHVPAPDALATAELCGEAEESLGFSFRDLNAFFLVFTGSKPEHSAMEVISISSMEWIGKTIIDWYIMKWMMDNLPAWYQEDSLTAAFKTCYATENLLCDAVSLSRFGLWMQQARGGATWLKERDQVGFLHLLVGSMFIDSKRVVTPQLLEALRRILEEQLSLATFTPRLSARRR